MDAYASLGGSISTIESLEDGLQLASLFWLPTDDGLPQYLIHQQVHHEKRQRWASQLLMRMATSPMTQATIIHATTTTSTTTVIPESFAVSFSRLIHAAATPPPPLPQHTTDRLGKEATWIMDSLQAIHTLIGKFSKSLSIDSFAVQGIQHLIQRADALGADYPLDQACRVHWAIQGIQARLPSLSISTSNGDILKQRVEELPFAILPLGVDWATLVPDSHSDVCHTLLQEIPFARETIVTRQGTSVAERRGTAWIAAPGIGALAYSGKLMAPQPIPTLVEQVMRTVEQRLRLPDSFFDCALCNHYADATAACKFHTDPEHGTMWDRTTVVVAAGSDRVFAWKPITTTWNEWDIIPDISSGSVAATTTLFAGDLVVMRDNCNDDFYHAVHAGTSDDPRVSLVLKRAIGPRGHGLPGQGRRYKNRTKSPTLPMKASATKSDSVKPKRRRR